MEDAVEGDGGEPIPEDVPAEGEGLDADENQRSTRPGR
jgi:hypothetical protein